MLFLAEGLSWTDWTKAGSLFVRYRFNLEQLDCLSHRVWLVGRRDPEADLSQGPLSGSNVWLRDVCVFQSNEILGWT